MNNYTITDIGELIKDNAYVGRGIVTGLSQSGKYACVAYFIMGRSANSRNRIFKMEDGALFTKPFDESKVGDPSLIIYAAMRKYKNDLIVTKGDQTDTIYDGLKAGKSFSEALRAREFEPDAPNLTPVKGLGHFLHTYVTDGNPLPTFLGEPERVFIPDDQKAFTETLWNNLNDENKISLFVRYIDLESGENNDILINKNA